MDFFGKELEEKQNEYWEVDNINSQTCISKAVSLGPDVICLFGTSILNQNWLEAFPKRVVNLHLGLSPFYRGSATLFWPFFFKELKYLGATIHLATAKVDAGEIIARIDADFRLEDDYYNITTRLIKDSIDRFPEVVASYLGGWIKTFAQENVDGRICRKSDFSEEALREVLEYIGRGLTAKEIAKIHKERACRYLG
jgi:folate-dependent phosphoribosylglycinamide formyltransferase PurN